MCVMSYVYDYGKTVPDHHWWITPNQPNSPAIEDFRKLLDDAQKFDEDAGEPHCEDPEKEKWWKDLNDRISKLEGCEKKKFNDKDIVMDIVDHFVDDIRYGYDLTSTENDLLWSAALIIHSVLKLRENND